MIKTITQIMKIETDEAKAYAKYENYLDEYDGDDGDQLNYQNWLELQLSEYANETYYFTDFIKLISYDESIE